MWQLKNKDGKLLRYMQPTAWAACRGYFHKNGKPYKRNQVLAQQDSLVVYEIIEKRVALRIPVYDESGNVMGEKSCMSNVRMLSPCYLEKI